MSLRAVLLDEDQLIADKEDRERLVQAFTHCERFASSTPQQCTTRLRFAEVVITNGTPLTREQLSQAKHLRLILIGGTGYEYIDLQAASELGIAIYNCREYGVDSIAQHTFALMLALTNSIPQFQRTVRSQQWQQAGTFCLLSEPISELKDKTLAIIGCGAIGQRVQALAQAFGMTVKLAELPGRPLRSGRTPLDDLLPLADIVSLHCPLTEQTHTLFTAERLALMKPSAFLINTARGAIVDEQALAEALAKGKLAGAGIDVFCDEPPCSSHPLLAEALSTKVIATPHVAWGSVQARQKLVYQMVENFCHFTEGNTLRRVI
ncbi:NAD(P)-dependent oxidoreductase [Rosenbergiella epipactidis]|uniref:NAD(P)-dependent oxidoreductase n=1 Tax=Rosenbergiella epipactidis TaxID=1544694 RepID=UPI001F4EAB35|nr:NAD(P)-dependent oxidoreductase [Rosenbergiella epipactidis]